MFTTFFLILNKGARESFCLIINKKLTFCNNQYSMTLGEEIKMSISRSQSTKKEKEEEKNRLEF